MALNDKRTGGTTGSKGKTADIKNMFNDDDTTTDNVNISLDAYGDDLFLTGEKGSEYTNQFAETTKKALGETKLIRGMSVDTKVIKLDKAIFRDLLYSYVLYVTKADKSAKTYVHISCLEITGNKPIPASQILEEIKFKQQNARIYVTSDSFDAILLDIISKVLIDGYGTKKEDIVFTQGFVVPYDADIENTATIAAVIAFNNNIARLGFDLNILKYKDFKAFAPSREVMTQLNVSVSNNTISALGRPIRSDFDITLERIINKVINNSIPRSIRENEVSSVGYFEYIVDEVQSGFGMPPKKMIQPLVIIDEIHGKRATLDTMLLGIVNAATFGNPNNLFSTLMKINRDIGVLNMLCNLDNEKSGMGKKIKLKDGKLSPDKIYQILTAMVKPSPIIAVEVEYYGANFGSEFAFAALQDPNKTGIANAEILSAAEAMTGQQFQNKTVAANEGILIPIGEFVDSQGNKRDIREVDLAYVVEHATDMQLVMKWIASNAPASATGMDPYLLKLEVINELIPNAVITGKAARIILNGNFVSELIAKAMGLGYNPKSDIGAIGFTGFNNLQAVAAAYAGAELRNNNFGTYQQQTQFYTPYGNIYGM